MYSLNGWTRPFRLIEEEEKLALEEAKDFLGIEEVWIEEGDRMSSDPIH